MWESAKGGRGEILVWGLEGMDWLNKGEERKKERKVDLVRGSFIKKLSLP